MKRFVAALILLGFGHTSKAQFVNDGAVLSVSQSGLLHIGTDYIHQDGQIENAGTIQIDHNWMNYAAKGVFKGQQKGMVQFSGQDQLIGGSMPTSFGRLWFTGDGVKTLAVNAESTEELNLLQSELATGAHVFFLSASLPQNLLRLSGGITSSAGGGFKRNTSLSQPYVFPLAYRAGKSLAYRPLIVTPELVNDNTFQASLITETAGFLSSSIQKQPEVQKLNERYYYTFKRPNGTSNAKLDVLYNKNIEGNFSTLLRLNSSKQLQSLGPVKQAEGNFSDLLNEKLAIESISDFSSEGIVMAQTAQNSVDPELTIPTVVTANNDGKNDSWIIPELASYPKNQVVIFNRWGSEVYRQSAYSAH